MSSIRIEQSAVINAQPAAVYAVIADYHVGHQAILPKPFFAEMIVEQGGQGAGTKLKLTTKAMGSEQVYHLTVSEPEPGRILHEADVESGVATSFVVEPINGGAQSRVTIISDMRTASGVIGAVERVFNPPFIRRLFKQELQQLNDYVRSKAIVA